MAEFKLGRIRFIWKGAWLTGTTYVKDDVIRQGGKVFLCVTGHTASADFTTDNTSGYWQLTADGSAWVGTWATSTYYKLNDLVKYGGIVYICNTTHTSASTSSLGLENDQAKWTLFAQSFNWVGNWATSTRYKAKDVVKYGGETYVCNLGHTSAATTGLGLENDQAKWDIFAEGLVWLTDWTTSTKFRINDVVRYGGILYVCNTAHTSAATAALGLENDQSKWDYLHKGFNYLGAWSASSVRYKINDVVKNGADLWICTTQHTSSATFSTTNFTKFVEGLTYFNTWVSGTTYAPGALVTYGGFVYEAILLTSGTTAPSLDATNWTLFTSGFTYIGAWSNSTAYQVGNVVTVGGYTYVAIADGTNKIPATQTLFWSQLNSGFRYLATGQTFTGLSPTNVTGSGSGAVFSVTISGTTYTVTKTSNGTGYSQTGGSNTIKILGTQVGGTTPFNDITITITAVTTGAISTFTYVGIATTWAAATAYVAGDTVFYGPNSYVCILANTNQNPASDSNGTYWNLLAQGTSTAVLTTQGDMVYYGGAGPTRLPIGTTGQVLTVSPAGLPNWTYWGVVNQVFYVSATTGTNSPAPAYGTTVDKPWATVRYAAYQAEAGTQFPNSTNLLLRNRSYIQKEVIAWINAQITLNTGIWAGFTYNATKCERDIGFVVDALAWDLAHGGNEKSRNAALAYVNSLTGTNPATTGTYSLLATQSAPDVASYNQMLVVVNAIIANTAPGTTYQSSVTRVADATKTAETGASTLLSNLMGIITAAIAAQVSTNIPAQVIPNITINVKTGTYYETLPIVVPQNTAIVGDELRSANIRPVIANGTNSVYQYDTPYSLLAISRLAAVVSTLVQNSAVSVTSSGPSPNGVTQVTTRPASTSTVGTQLQQLFYSYSGYVNYNVTNAGAAVTFTGSIATTTLTVTSAPTGSGLYVGYVLSGGGLTANTYIITANLTGTGTAASSTWTISASTTQSSTTLTATAASPYGTNTQTATQANYDAVEILYENTNFLVAEAVAYVATTYNTTATATTNGSASITVGDSTKTPLNARVTFTGTPFGSISTSTVYYVVNVVNSTTIQVATTQSGSASTWTAGTGTLTVALYYPLATCQRDVQFIIAAMQYDIQYPGNYKTLQAAQWYANGVNGSVIQNMFLVRNGCGVRNMTLQGLTGTLSSANAYGTKRPTAGAYVSLDPGWGPADSRTWVNTRSCYVQNVTTFGIGCVGAKIDGTLHNGGNRSIVANDFTQVLSDGIGVWCTGSGSLTELVSVFAYYGYAGYLAEAGGKIRATNGNSSYGTYGVLAEGVDATETPITATIDNRSTQAYITNTLTDGTNNIWRFEYLNAGSNYNTASFSIAGTGYNAATVGNEFRDQAVFETRITNSGTAYNSALSTPLTGTYVSSSSTGQSGDRFSISIAATDLAINNAYQGMRIILLSGSTGAGQTGYIVSSSSSATKLVCVAKESVPTITATQATNSTVSATGFINGTIMTLTSVAAGTATAGQVLVGSGITANTYITAVNSASFTGAIALGTAVTFTGSIGSGTLTITTAPTGTGVVVGYILSGGTIPANTYVTANLTGTATSSSSTWSVNQTAVTQTSTTITATPVILTASAVTGNIAVGQVVGGGTSASTFITALGTGTSGAGTYYVSISQTVTSQAMTGTSYQVSTSQTVGFGSTITGTQNGISVASTASLYVGMPLYMTGTTIGGLQQSQVYYVLAPGLLSNQFAVSTLAGGTAVSLSNQTASTMIINAAGWDHVVPGTPISASLDVTTNYIIEPRITYSSPGFTATPVTQQSGTWIDGVYGDTIATYTTISATGGTGAGATFTVVRTGTSYAVTLAGIGSAYVNNDSLTIAGTSLGGTSANNITVVVTLVTTSSTLGQILNFTYSGTGAGGVYVAIPASGTGTQYSYNGTTWTAGGALSSLSTGSYSAITYGNGYFVAVNTGGTVSSLSTNGTTWSAGGALPVSTAWTAVAYGNPTIISTVTPTFVAIASGGTNTAYSTNNGTTWTISSGGLPASSTWTAIAYGNGVFVAIAGGTAAATNAAYSANGTTWLASTLGLPSSQIWTSLTFGNGRFVAVSEAGKATAYSFTGSVWYASAAGLPATQTWTKVRYGQGLFMASAISLAPTITATTASSNLVTLSSTVGLAAGESLVPTAITQTPTVSATTLATPAVMNSTNITGTTLNVGSVASGSVAVGMVLTGTGVITGTYIISGGGLTWTVSQNHGAGTGSITITGNNSTITVATTSGLAVGESFVPTAVTQSTTLTTTQSSGVGVVVSNSTGMIAGEPIVFSVAGTQTPTLNSTATGTNIATLSSGAGLSQGASIVFTAVTQTPQLLTTSSTGNFLALASTTGLAVNESIVFTAVTQTPTLQATYSANNFLQLSNVQGLVVGEPIVFTAVTQTPSAATASTNALATSTGSTIAGSVLTVGGSLSGTWAVGMMLAGSNIQTQQSINTTGATGTGTNAILSFSAQGSTPFVVGQQITVTGMVPTGYNGTFTVTAASTTSVTYALIGVTASQVTAGVISCPGTYISALGGGSGGAGTYILNITHPTIAVGQSINGTNNLITLGSTTGMSIGEPIVFSGTTFGGIGSGSTYYITQIVDATRLAVTATYNNNISNLTVTSASGSMTVSAGASMGGITGATTYYITSIINNFITVSTSFGSTAVSVSNSVGTWTSAAGNIVGGGFGTGTAVATTYYVGSIVNNTISMTGSTISLSAANTTQAGNVLTVGTLVSGTIVVGMILTGTGVAANTYITANLSGSGTGSTWYVSTVQLTTSTTVTGNSNNITIALSPGGSTITQSNAAGYWTSVAGATFGGLTAGTTYYLATIASANVTLSTSPTLSPIVSLANGAGGWNSIVGTVMGGLQAGLPYYILTNNTGTNTLTVSATYNGSPFVVSNGVGAWNAVAGGAYNQAVVTGLISNGSGLTAGNTLTPTGLASQTGTIATSMIVTGTGVTANYTTISSVNTGTVVSGTVGTTLISTTGTVGSVSGSGPWTATLSGLTAVTNLVVGATITATYSTAAGTTGALYQGEPTSVIVTGIVSATSITYQVTGGLTPLAGTILNLNVVQLVAGATSTGIAPGQILSGGSISPNTAYIVGQTTASGATVVGATATANTGTNILTLATFTTGTISSVVVGQFVTPVAGVIPANTFVTSVNTGASTITISNNTLALTNTAITLITAGGQGNYVLNATLTAQPIASITTPSFSNITAGGGTVAVSAISGAGTLASPWVATLTGGSAFDLRYVQVGSWIQATSGTGAIFGGSPSVATVTAVTSNTVIIVQVYNNTGGTGTTPVAGNVSACLVPALTTAASTTGLANAEILFGGSVTYGSYIIGQATSTVATIVAATGTGTSGTNTIVLSTYTTGAVGNLVVGQLVSDAAGAAVPGGTTITLINTGTNTITISNNLKAALAGAVTITTAGAQGTYALNQITSGTPTNAYVPATETVTGTPTTAISYTVSNAAQLVTSTSLTMYATSGTTNLGGLVSGNTYFILTIPTAGASGTVTLGSVYGGSPLALTNANAAWTSSFGSVFGGLTSAATYYIASIVGSQVTLSTSATLTPILTLTTQGGTWNAVAGATPTAATSEDGITWTPRTLSATSSWPIVMFGNPSSVPTWVALTSSTTTANSIATGITAQARLKVTANLLTELRMIEPGSGYSTTPVVTVTDPNASSTGTTNTITSITVSGVGGQLTVPTGNYVVGQAITFTGSNSGTAGSSWISGYTTGNTYYVMTGGSQVTSIRITNTYANAIAGTASLTTIAAATVGITGVLNFTVRTGNGALANPTFTNRGTAYATVSTVTVTGNGYADLYQTSSFINIRGLYSTPTAGSNITLGNGDPTYYKLVAITNTTGTGGGQLPNTATFQINPAFTTTGTNSAPAHGTSVTLRLKYSQVRLTGHDFLNIGTGNQTSTNYPNTPAQAPDSTKQTVANGGGRVFFTSTDQDGNFNVGNLFTVVQSTGVATLNANAFNLAGLQSLTLGSVALGTGSATITSFSTDPYFTANSDNVVPTQKAIKSYISSQIGGGGSSLNVNTLTAGVIYIANNVISTTTGVQIIVNNKMYFVGGVDGVPLAMNFLLS